MPSAHHRVLVIGGGNAGLSLAGRVRRGGVTDVAVVDPQTTHHYKPLYSHIAGGRARAREAIRPQADVMPRGVTWIRDAAASVDPDARTVTLASGDGVGYDQLVVAPGLVKEWDGMPGLAAALEQPWATSSYRFDLAQKTSRALRDLRSGTVVFAEPSGPASCSGAIQKPMYLACDYWRAIGVRDDIRVVLLVPGETVFGVRETDRELDRVVAGYGIEVRTRSELVAIDPAARELTVDGPDGEERMTADLVVVEPRSSAPAWIAASGLAGEGSGGFVEVDTYSLRHRRFRDVWSLGDAADLGVSKSGGALRRQTKIAAENILAVLDGRQPLARYDGYSVCPFTVSRDTVVFSEFDRRHRLMPSFPQWTGLSRESRRAWILDRWVLPWVYWHMILQGRA